MVGQRIGEKEVRRTAIIWPAGIERNKSPIYINYIKKVGAEGGIVSEGVAQVVDKRAIPSSLLHNDAVGSLSDFVSLCRSASRFVALFNTYITPPVTPYYRHAFKPHA